MIGEPFTDSQGLECLPYTLPLSAYASKSKILSFTHTHTFLRGEGGGGGDPNAPKV